jgi:CRISPR-associated endonuclease/helicase Cas3
MQLLAHSARPKLGIPEQPYVEHVCNVVDQAFRNACECAKYFRGDGERIMKAVRIAAEFHDLGKLDQDNQKVLASSKGKGELPINHVDAGVAHLFRPENSDAIAAALVYAHHIGLPDFEDKRLETKAGCFLRDIAIRPSGHSTQEITDQRLNDYLEKHQSAIQTTLLELARRETTKQSDGLRPLDLRMALSCLVDADHYDTARNYNNAIPAEGPPLRPVDRLAFLDAYVENLTKTKTDERTAFRTSVYRACKEADTTPHMYACDSPVGTGKTTAVMAHLLKAASNEKLRRTFVVLPFTNIIDQSVEVYRCALIGHGEWGEDVVAAHHHRAEFDGEEARQFSFLWHAPIVVTTAVQFFETLASNHPSALRKLHQLPGSAIFLDEAHAALPAHLWPQAWLWLRELTSRWGCHFVLGSGSLNRFWELEEFSNPPAVLPELIPYDVKTGVSSYETARVRYQTKSAPQGISDLLEWVLTVPGPRLMIVNAVQSAAFIAQQIHRQMGGSCVEHLSTALCPRDRKATLNRVKRRLADESDSDWTLVATSCVEAGVDLSFRNGFREQCSLNSLIQTGGRINRNGEFTDSIVWDFELRHDDYLRNHPAFKDSSQILGELFQENRVNAQSSTEAMRREVRRQGLRDSCEAILKAERNKMFPLVEKEFRVIDSYTVTAIVDQDLIARLEGREPVAPHEIQALSVQIWAQKQEHYALRPIGIYSDMFAWTLMYDEFIGYMAGILQVLNHQKNGSIV